MTAHAGARALLFNGVPSAPDLSWHRGLQYGDGIFRTCLIYTSKVIDITEQIMKASHDAQALGLEPPPVDVLAQEAAALAEGQEHGVLKLMLLRAGAERGYRGGSRGTDRLLCRFPAPHFPAGYWDAGIRARRADFRLAAQPVLAGVKHLNRLEQVLASRDWPDDADELIVEDPEGRPLSGTRTNLFWVTGDTLRTPSLDRCGVAGLMRDKVLAAARTLGLRAQGGAGSWSELAGAEEAFVTNSLVGIWPLASLDDWRWDAPGPLTRQLMQQLHHPRLVNA